MFEISDESLSLTKILLSIITEDMTDERLSFVISYVKMLSQFTNININLI